MKKEGKIIMIRKSIPYALIFFVTLTLWQWFFKSEIDWKNNIGVAVTVFLVYLFIEWTSKRYEHKKN